MRDLSTSFRCALARFAWHATVCLVAEAAAAETESTTRQIIAEMIDIAEVPSDLRVGFCLLTTPERQFVAYYAANGT